jgi:hypothetical protein
MDKIIKIMMICLLFSSCVNIKMKEVIRTNTVVAVSVLEDGSCEYLVQPRLSTMIYINDICEYDIGDSIQWIDYVPDVPQ